jgi:hypothetical protein
MNVYGCLRPQRLPRKISSIVMAVLYSPPEKSAQEQQDLVNYLIESLDHTRNKFPDCGIVLLGDFNTRYGYLLPPANSQTPQ